METGEIFLLEEFESKVMDVRSRNSQYAIARLQEGKIILYQITQAGVRKLQEYDMVHISDYSKPLTSGKLPPDFTLLSHADISKHMLAYTFNEINQPDAVHTLTKKIVCNTVLGSYDLTKNLTSGVMNFG